MKQLIKWFAQNSVPANIILWMFIIGGIISIFTIQVELFPDVSPDLIKIRVVYPGASPQEVEEGVIKPIEEEISGLSGIEKISSTAEEGIGVIFIDVIKGWDTDKLLDEIKSAIERIATLPKDIEKPVVEKGIRRFPVISIAIYGDADERTLKNIGERLKEELKKLPEVTEVRVYAVRPEEIHIEVSKETLERHNLSLIRLANIIRKHFIDLPLGKIVSANEEILLRAKGKFTEAEKYSHIPILTKEGRIVTLGEIAQIKDEFKDDIFLAGYFEGKRAVIVQVFRVGEQNDFKISKQVEKFLEEFKTSLPEGVHLTLYFDTTTLIKERLSLLVKNLLIGLTLVSILLALFLHPKLAFWVALGIPVSFFFALWLLPYFDVSINMISLFAFILVLGLVVDDAIVVGESIFRKKEAGLPPLQSAIEGTLEVHKPVIFAILTTIAAFYPLLLGTGLLGKVIKHIPIVVILVLIGSLIKTLLVMPYHLGRTKVSFDKKQKWLFFNQKLKEFVEGPFKNFLVFCLKYRYITLAVFGALIIILLGIIIGGRTKITVFPPVEADQIDCYLTMPPGTPIEKTLKIAKEIEKAGIEAVPDYARKYSFIMLGVHMVTHGPRAGLSQIGSNIAQISIRLKPYEERNRLTAKELAERWRKKLGVIPEAKSIVFETAVFTVGKEIEFNFYMKDQNKLLEAIKEFKEYLKKIPGVYEITDSFIPGKKEINIKLKPLAYKLGLTLEDVALQIKAGFQGVEALRFIRGEEEVKVIVRLPKNERQDISSLYDFKIFTPTGKTVKVKDIANLEISRGYLSLNRVNLKRVITVSANVDEKIADAKEIRAHLIKNVIPKLQQKYPGLTYSIEGAGKEYIKSFQDIWKGFIFAVFLIYLLLAFALNSFLKPFLVLSAIPFGIIGAILGHILLKEPLCMLSFFGIVGLAGVVVNDSLLLLDRIERTKDKSKNIFDTVVEATIVRFRPVFLTTITTFIGVTPLIFETSVQAKVLIPMAISLGFGVLFATLITLVLVPCSYLVLEDLKK